MRHFKNLKKMNCGDEVILSVPGFGLPLEIQSHENGNIQICIFTVQTLFRPHSFKRQPFKFPYFSDLADVHGMAAHNNTNNSFWPCEHGWYDVETKVIMLYVKN